MLSLPKRNGGYHGCGTINDGTNFLSSSVKRCSRPFSRSSSLDDFFDLVIYKSDENYKIDFQNIEYNINKFRVALDRDFRFFSLKLPFFKFPIFSFFSYSPDFSAPVSCNPIINYKHKHQIIAEFHLFLFGTFQFHAHKQQLVQKDH